MPTSLGTPDLYLKVEKLGRPYLLVNLYVPNDSGLQPLGEVWQDWLFCGLGEAVYLVSLANKQSQSYKISWYCSGFYPLEEFLLVLTSTNILCFDKSANLVWASEKVGLDGVTLEEVTANSIKGSGEWDPPGGWKPFELDFATGKIIGK